MSLPINTIKGISILLIDDETVAQLVHRKMLEKLGCHVESAKTAQQALTVSENEFDVIFMDIGLPDGNGIEVSSQIRSREKLKKRTPIIVITGYSQQDTVKDCIAAGVDLVLTKPISTEDLQTALSCVLQK